MNFPKGIGFFPMGDKPENRWEDDTETTRFEVWHADRGFLGYVKLEYDYDWDDIRINMGVLPRHRGIQGKPEEVEDFHEAARVLMRKGNSCD